MDIQEYERYSKVLIDGKGRLIEVPLRRGKGNTAFIDAISFTFHESTLCKDLDVPFWSSDDVARLASVAMLSIFGFGVLEKAQGTGGRFYCNCWNMMQDGVLYGRVHYGGQNDTVLVEITGKGCEVAIEGWEKRLHQFLSEADRPKITRCDVAKDFFKGEITPDKAYEAWQQGKFSKRGKQPIIDRYGSDWDCNTNKGKTLYVGSRNSGIFARIYDKAKQMGDKTADWTRFELQFQGKNVLIELDILLQPGAYFGGAFPICAKLQNDVGEAVRSLAKWKRFEMSVEQVKKNLRKQAGRGINALLSLGMNAVEIIDEIRNKEGLLPQRLNPCSFDLDFSFEPWLHQQPIDIPAWSIDL